MAKDTGLSIRKPGFEFPWGHYAELANLVIAPR